MDVVDAIKERKSIRAFKPDTVPLDLLKKIIEQALRAPSWANTQPWEFAVASGEKLKEIQEGFVARGRQDPQSEEQDEQDSLPSQKPSPQYSSCVTAKAEKPLVLIDVTFRLR